jgi:hypothetical protein
MYSSLLLDKDLNTQPSAPRRLSPSISLEEP